MKKIIMIAFMFILCISTKAEFIYSCSSSGGSEYFYNDNITRNEYGYYNVWVKTSNSIKNIITIGLYWYDKTTNRIKGVQYSEYDSNGNFVDSSDGNGLWDYIIPETAFEKVFQDINKQIDKNF